MYITYNICIHTKYISTNIYKYTEKIPNKHKKHITSG